MKKQDILENQAKNIFLGIGSNLGNRLRNIEKAKSFLLQNDINFISSSNYYQTPSWPDPKKPAFINVVLKYHNSSPVIKTIKRISKPSLRKYSPSNDLKPVKNGLGAYIISTNKGLMTDKDAKSKNVGGEILCEVF